MRFLLLLVTSAVFLSGCVTTVEVTHRIPVSENFISPQDRWAAQPDVMFLNRRQITAGIPAGPYVTGRFRYRYNYAGVMCFEQRRDPQNSVVYICTSRRYLDPKPVHQRLQATKRPFGHCGLRGAVYAVGPLRCTAFDGRVTYNKRYRGKSQHRSRHRGY